MAEDLSLKTDIPGLLSLVEITVPRWAANEPVPGEMVDVADLPENINDEKLSFTGSYYYHRRYLGREIYGAYRPGIWMKAPDQAQVSQSIFDQNGRLIEARRFEGDKEIEHETYHYNTSGQLIERILSDPFDEVSEKTMMTYTSEGQVRSRRTEYSDGSVRFVDCVWSHNVCEEVTTQDDEKSRKRTTYDRDGHIIEEVATCDDGSFGCGTAWTYDSDNITEVYSVLQDGSRVLTELSEYDDAGNLTRWSLLDTDGSTKQQREYQYEGGILIADVLYERDNETHTQYEYNSDGLLIRSFAKSELAEEEKVYSYNKNKLLEMTAERSSDEYYSNTISVYPTASTTWRVYQFYDKNQ